MKHFLSGRRIAGAIGAALLLAAPLGIGSAALGQDQSAATAKDVIFARKILMDTLSQAMDDIETMVSSDKIDIAQGQMKADLISVMMMAFPHLFPPASNQWKAGAPRDAATDTYAAPELWARFSEFYSQAANSSKIAYNLSRADNEAEFKKSAAELRTACNSCHASFQKTD